MRQFEPISFMVSQFEKQQAFLQSDKRGARDGLPEGQVVPDFSDNEVQSAVEGSLLVEALRRFNRPF